MKIEFHGEIWYWRGPSPFYFVTVPDPQCEALRAISSYVTYGWGMIPVKARIGQTEWKTSLFPKDGRYLVPLKDRIRKLEQLEEGQEVRVELEVG